MKRTNFWFLPLLFCSALLGPSHAAYAAGLEVRYDRERDRLSVQAEQVSLTQVLGRIAAQTGVEILMDPSIEKTVSMSLKGQPLEKALKQIARGLSYVMLYDSGKKQNSTQTPRLTTMKLLPEGKQDSPNLVPVAVLNARAGRHNRSLGGGNTVYKIEPIDHNQNIPRQKRSTRNESPIPADVVAGEGQVASGDAASTAQEGVDHAKQLTRKADKKGGKRPCTSPFCAPQQ